MDHARMLVNGTPAAMVPAMDRGLSYGDGLFETIRFAGTHAPLWSRHMQRLRESCLRLALPAPDETQLLHEAQLVTVGMADAVVRITLTRGTGQRGYAPPAHAEPTRMIAAFDAPPMIGEAYAQGVRVRWCELALSSQPRLAGIKHLNRLEQVLARAEWNDPAIADGLLCDANGHVISGTMSNVFAVIDGELVTPSLASCGVAGVARAEVLACHGEVRVAELPRHALQWASEVCLSSSVRGIQPVQRLGDTVYGPGPITRALQRHWCELGFPMEHA